MSPPAAAPPADRAAIELIATIIRDAEYMADLTVHFLDELGIVPPLKERRKKPVALPPEFLLELGAILRLALWERAGHRQSLNHHLPRAEQTLADLLDRFTRAPQDAQSAEVSSTLALEVFKVSLRRFAWCGREELRTDVVLDRPDDEVLLDALADLLWKHRYVGRLEE